MITAHELARKLLAGGDYEVVLTTGVNEHGTFVGAVHSASVIVGDDPVTKPSVVLVMAEQDVTLV